MPKQFNGEFTYNKIIVIQGLPEGEYQTGLRLAYDELNPICGQYNMGLDFIKVINITGLIESLKELEIECKNINKPIYPILHLDIHGASDKSGLVVLPSTEILKWSEFANYCRAINLACKNNLVIFMSVCYGLHAIRAISINHLTPFYALIGSEQIVNVGFLQSNIPKFYNSLFENSNLIRAVNQITPTFKLFLCEKHFVISIYKYLKKYCKGKGRKKRVEFLLSIYRKLNSEMKDITTDRNQFKKMTKAEKLNFIRYKNAYLLSNHPENLQRFNFSLDDIIELILLTNHN